MEIFSVQNWPQMWISNSAFQKVDVLKMDLINSRNKDLWLTPLPQENHLILSKMK